MTVLVAAHNPHVMARRLCHWCKIGWEHVAAVADAQINQLNLLRSGLGDSVDFPQLNSLLEDCIKVERCFAICGSPIEELFLAYLPEVDQKGFAWADRDQGTGASAVWGRDWLSLYQQRETLGYRLDFTIEGAAVKLAIELDGHAFHERTQLQSARDKSRDRALTAAGWRVIRFTGSEIWNDPRRSTLEAFSIARDAAQ